MLPRSNRLSTKDIPYVLRHGAVVHGIVFDVKYRKTTGIPRFACIISAKVDRRATARNRMRRVISESVRHLLPAMQPVDAIIVVKKNVADLPQTAMELFVRQVFTTIHILSL